MSSFLPKGVKSIAFLKGITKSRGHRAGGKQEPQTPPSSLFCKAGHGHPTECGVQGCQGQQGVPQGPSWAPAAPRFPSSDFNLIKSTCLSYSPYGPCYFPKYISFSSFSLLNIVQIELVIFTLQVLPYMKQKFLLAIGPSPGLPSCRWGD